MLEYLRNAADKPLAKFLMFVLVFSFVGWGVADWIFSGRNTESTLVSIGNTDVSEQQFNTIYSNTIKSKDRKEQQRIYKDPAASLQIKKDLLSDLVRNHLVLNRAKDLGFMVSNERIEKIMYSNIQGYMNNYYRLEGFAEELRAEELYNMTTGAISSLPLNIPNFMVDAAYNARYATRDIKYDTVKFSSFKVENPTEEQLQEYYAQNPHLVPEARSVSYVLVAADTSKPDEDDIANKTIEDIQMEVLLSDSSDTNDPMKIAADAHKAKFVQLPAFKRGETISDKVMSDPMLRDMVFSMDVDFSKEANNYSTPQGTSKGYVLFRVDKIIPEHNAELKDIKKDLISGWKKAEQRKQAYIQANERLIDLNKNGSLKDNKMKSVSRTEGAPLSVLNAAFAGKPGDNTIVEDTDAFYVLHIDKNTVPKQDAKKKTNMRKDLQSLSKEYVGDDYLQFLKREYRVKINDAGYKRSIGQ